eukprot:TRINITY_DN4420_c0_g1_i1.p1 TRINITY_DN4420_c0_g1~~TRINITY_DN4420_c0_g1_i1.p1  ORF type:complete len:299 (-),score=87.39 TRINITY_DN4420_c0_g1_i1:149-1045(-)
MRAAGGEMDVSTASDIKKELDKWPALDVRKVRGLLSQLEKPVPLKTVKDAKLPNTVKKIFTDAPNGVKGSEKEIKEVVEMARSIYTKWKSIHKEDKRSDVDKTVASSRPEPPKGRAAVPERAKGNGVQVPPNFDPKREKMVNLLHKTLAGVVKAVDSDKNLLETVFGIEDAIYQVNRGVNERYNERMKELIINVKKQEEVARKIYQREFDAKFVATCDFIHLAGDEAKKKVETIKKKMDDEADLDKEVEVLPTTTQYKCPRCEINEAYYNEKQTRSADEPCTIFLKCKACSTCWSIDP